MICGVGFVLMIKCGPFLEGGLLTDTHIDIPPRQPPHLSSAAFCQVALACQVLSLDLLLLFK
jgi:hypothetical protein